MTIQIADFCDFYISVFTTQTPHILYACDAAAESTSKGVLSEDRSPDLTLGLRLAPRDYCLSLEVLYCK